MPYRISYCVIFVTIIWGAFAANEEQTREIFQSNMTRNDFSNLLKSLIKLNEQRVNVLQKLYRLEDYGILSEVLRSGQTRTKTGNSNNLLLVVLSKNAIDTRSSSKASSELPDDDESENLWNEREGTLELSNVAKDELLDLLILDDEALTRRSLSKTDDMKSKESFEDDSALRTHSKHKKSRKEKLKHLDESSEFHHGLEDEADEFPVEILKEGDTLGAEKSLMSSSLRSACVKETNKGIEKCTRACNRAHEDVCDRLNCSVRSKRALRKECDFNCRKVFNPRLCY